MGEDLFFLPELMCMYKWRNIHRSQKPINSVILSEYAGHFSSENQRTSRWTCVCRTYNNNMTDWTRCVQLGLTALTVKHWLARDTVSQKGGFHFLSLQLYFLLIQVSCSVLPHTLCHHVQENISLHSKTLAGRGRC